MKKLILYFLLPLTGLAQNTIGLPDIINYSKADYKAGLQNWDFKQDNNGIIYIANNEGLLSYDGTYWKLYPLPNKTIVRSVEIGADNKIWVATKTSFSRGDGGGKVFCSADGGATFTDKYTVTANGGGARTEIEASATNPNLIYVLAQLKQAILQRKKEKEVRKKSK